jgi:hypothetical protein
MGSMVASTSTWRHGAPDAVPHLGFLERSMRWSMGGVCPMSFLWMPFLVFAAAPSSNGGDRGARDVPQERRCCETPLGARDVVQERRTGNQMSHPTHDITPGEGRGRCLTGKKILVRTVSACLRSPACWDGEKRGRRSPNGEPGREKWETCARRIHVPGAAWGSVQSSSLEVQRHQPPNGPDIK